MCSPLHTNSRSLRQLVPPRAKPLPVFTVLFRVKAWGGPDVALARAATLPFARLPGPQVSAGGLLGPRGSAASQCARSPRVGGQPAAELGVRRREERGDRALGPRSSRASRIRGGWWRSGCQPAGRAATGAAGAGRGGRVRKPVSWRPGWRCRWELRRVLTARTLLQQIFWGPGRVPGASWLPTPLSAPPSVFIPRQTGPRTCGGMSVERRALSR